MKTPIYFDYAATTPVDPRVAQKMSECLLAEGKADFYPRLGPTSEWDTAAAHAVVLAAGGKIVTLDGKPLRYNTKKSLLNPEFLVIADPGRDWLSAFENYHS